jgi:hypothetical protein
VLFQSPVPWRLRRIECVYLIGFVPLHVVSAWLAPWLLPRMLFLPLVMTSVYCACGVAYVWVKLVFDFWQHVELPRRQVES